MLLELAELHATEPSEQLLEAAARDEGEMRGRRELLTTKGLSVTDRGRKAAVGDLALLWELAGLSELLSMDEGDKALYHNTARIVARLDCGHQRQMQYVRATKSFMKKPWSSFVK